MLFEMFSAPHAGNVEQETAEICVKNAKILVKGGKRWVCKWMKLGKYVDGGEEM
jgi:hypothetical protein